MLLAQTASAVEITNFRSGLACTNGALEEGAAGWICQPTEDILMTDQGQCIYNDETIRCTWFGFEFDYKSNTDETNLRCESETSIPTDSGNPEGILERGATSHRYELKLEGRNGHFFNPQYFGFQVRPADASVIVVNGSCRSDDADIFRYRFNLRFPTTPKAN